jgi:ABC-type Fe3+/spermidine/putrescine transport system ATPase subunit
MIAGQLSFENAFCNIGDNAILKELKLQINVVEVAGLLGQSGCGKTTLGRIAAGIQRTPARGMLIDGEVVEGLLRCVAPERCNVGLVSSILRYFTLLRCCRMWALAAVPWAGWKR